MAKNEQSSKDLARLASFILTGHYDEVSGSSYQDLLQVAYALAGSVLTQAPDKPKPKTKAKSAKKKSPNKLG